MSHGGSRTRLTATVSSTSVQWKYSNTGPSLISHQECSIHEFVFIFLQERNQQWSERFGANVMGSDLRDARRSGLRSGQHCTKVQVMCQYDSVFASRPLHEFLVSCICSTEVRPMHTVPALRLQKLSPTRRQIHVDKEILWGAHWDVNFL